MSEKVRKYTRRGALFCSGGAGYGLMETAYRGYTHISMLLAGGLCLCLLVRISKTRRSMPAKIMTGAFCVTALEFFAGCVVNLWLGLKVWDYSDEPFNLLGQVCPRFTLLWTALCAIIIPVCSALAQNFGDGRIPAQSAVVSR